MKNNDGIIADYIVKKYIDSISGFDIPEILVESDINRLITVGVLNSEQCDQKYDPIPSMGFTAIIKKQKQANFNINFNGLVFYTIKPEYNDVINYFINYYNVIDNTHYKNIDEVFDKHPTDKKRFPNVYKKVELKNALGDGFNFSLIEGKGNYIIDLSNELNDKLNFLGDDIFNNGAIADTPMLIDISDLLDVQTYNKKVGVKDLKSQCQWDFRLVVKVKEKEDSWLIEVYLVNKSEINSLSVSVEKIFNSSVCLKADDNVEILGTDLKCYEKTIKKKEPVYAVGHNCTIEFNKEKNTIKTVSVPIFYQHRLKTNDKFKDYTSFDELIKDPISNLKFIYDKMEEDYSLCVKEFNKVKDTLNKDQINKFEEDLKLYEDEIAIFKVGINRIEFDDKVYKAFRYMNETFNIKLESEKWKIPGWRLFQLVFIVSMIPYVIKSEYPNDDDLVRFNIDMTNLLFFPTGGGKTEAFLGVSTFTMFFDRLRGKNDGVTSFIKYPLRLLAVQQLERAIKTVVKANIVRNNHEELSNAKEFEVGFFVGSGNTPNKLSGKDGIVGKSDSEINEMYRFIDTCPLCGEKKVHLVFDEKKYILRHVCNNPKCNMNELPLYITDEEIYRYLPSIVVSTIDKMAMIGTTKEFNMLFGQSKYRCPKHGYMFTNKCNAFNCDEKNVTATHLKDPAPTVYIQDEMHLVRESLGTFDAHYESFIKYYVKNLLPEDQRKSICYIGATATISEYDKHISNLYGTDARRFPCEYPSINDDRNFYSFVDKDDVTRIMLGYASFGKHPSATVSECITKFRKIVYGMMLNYESEFEILKEKGITCNKEEFKDLLYNYWISIVYNNKKNDATTLSNILGNQENNYLTEWNIPNHNIKEMTSDESFQEVRKTLFDINENRYKLNEINTILATSTISHGVDEDSFNIIAFYGMPNNNAEYIQAYSRTGRKYTGIVVDIIAPIKLRDVSYLKNFIQFHENKDDLIESVPINKWARNAIYSTLPGIFAGVIMQFYGPKLNMDLSDANNVKKAFQDQIKCDDLKEIIKNIYGCISSEPLAIGYETIINEEVEKIFNGIRDNIFNSKERIGEAIGKYSKGRKKPMLSLRDTDEQVIITAGGY